MKTIYLSVNRTLMVMLEDDKDPVFLDMLCSTQETLPPPMVEVSKPTKITKPKLAKPFTLTEAPRRGRPPKMAQPIQARCNKCSLLGHAATHCPNLSEYEKVQALKEQGKNSLEIAKELNIGLAQVNKHWIKKIEYGSL